MDDIFKYLYQNELNTPVQTLEVGLLPTPPEPSPRQFGTRKQVQPIPLVPLGVAFYELCFKAQNRSSEVSFSTYGPIKRDLQA